MPIRYTIESLNLTKPVDSKLKVVKFIKTDSGKRCLAVCVCGKSVITKPYRVANGHTKSCGCLVVDIIKVRSTKYFPVVKEIYSSYKSMMNRCYNTNNSHYKYYGAKGVTVCEEWRNDYQKFLDWSLVNGWGKGLQIDKDILGNGFLYSPTTCKWVTSKENSQNKTTNKIYEYRGIKMTISEISKIVKIPANVLSMRMYSRNGKTLEDAISMGKPTGKSGNTQYHNFDGNKLSLMSIAKLKNVSYSALRRYVNDLHLPLEEALKTIQ